MKRLTMCRLSGICNRSLQAIDRSLHNTGLLLLFKRDPNRVKEKLNIEINRARREDAKIVSSILYDAFISFKPLYTLKAFNATAISAEKVLERINQGPVLLATINGEVAGTVSMMAKQEGYYIRGMAVLPNARGNRIGWKLLQYIEAEALTNDLDRMYLYTTPFLLPAINLYHHYGFKRAGNRLDDFFGTNVFCMEKFIQAK